LAGQSLAETLWCFSASWGACGLQQDLRASVGTGAVQLVLRLHSKPSIKPLGTDQMCLEQEFRHEGIH